MVYKPGESGNIAGRKKGTISVKNLPIHIIYHVFQKYGKEGFEKKLIEIAQANPLKYYETLIRPIQPRDLNLFSNDDEAQSIEVTIKKTYEQGLKDIGLVDTNETIKITRTT